jgi:hypothetical protein
MDVRLRLTISESTRVDVWRYGAYRLRFVVDATENIDHRVFIFHHGTADPLTGVVVDYFERVAGPVDLEEIPPDAPDPTRMYPFFRKDVVELDARSTEIAEHLKHHIQKQLEVLVDAVPRLADLSQTTEVWIGGPQPADGSFSSYSSSG